MMSTMAPGYSLEQPQLVYRPTQVAQLTASVRASDTPWLYSALTQIWNIEQSGERVPGLGDLRIAEATATRARLLLSAINLIELPTPRVAPVSGGGMSIEWEVGQKEVKFAFYPDGVTMYFQVQEDEISTDGTLATMMPNEVTGPLKWMLDVQS